VRLTYRGRHKALQDFLDKQINDKKIKAEEEFIQEKKESSMAQALGDVEDKNFYRYAERCIKEWNDAGKSVQPLLIELKTYKNKVK